MLTKIKSDNLTPKVSKFFESLPVSGWQPHQRIFLELSRMKYTSLIRNQIYVNTYKLDNI